MTTEFIDVVVREKGAKQTAEAVGSIGSAARNAVTPLNILKNTLGALISLQGLSLLRQTVDTYANYQNRLRVVTSSTEELNVVTERLFDIANRTRSTFQNTTEIFARFSLVAKDAGFNQEQLLQITENLNKATLISGANTREANNALIQLAQGFAAGTLRGDELNSTFEQLPIVLQFVAREMGVTVGQIRELASEGKITSNILGNALLNATDDLNNKFGLLKVTIEQAGTVAVNKFFKMTGELDQLTGASTAVANSISILAENIDLILIPVGLRLIQVYGAAGLIRTFTTLTGVLVSLRGAMILTASTAGIFATFGTVVGGVASILLGPLLLGLTTIIASAILAKENFKKFADSVGIDGEKALLNILGAIDATSKLLVGFINGTIEVVRELFKRIAREAVNLQTAVGQGIADAFGVGETYRKAFGKDEELFTQHAFSLGEIFKFEFRKSLESGGTDFLGQYYKEQLDKQFPGAKVDLTKNGGKPPLETSSEDLKKAQKEIEDALKRQQNLLKDIKGDMFDYNQTVGDLNVLLKEGKISQTEFNDTLTELNLKLLETDKTIKGGLMRGAQELQKEFSNLGELAEDSLVRGFKSAEDALVDFTTKGKADFKGLVTSILADVARMQIRQSITGPLSGLLSSGLQGLFGNSGMTATAFAAKQTANVNTGLYGPGFATGGSFMVGGTGGTDSQVVRFRASPNERVTIETPEQQKNRNSGTSINLNFSIDARGADVGVEQRIEAAINQARSGIVREAMSAVKEEQQRSPSYLR